MAFSLNSSGGLGRGRFRRGNDSLAEINIVPLVDVVLVLLIIFMLTAHVMEFGLQIEVPKVKPVNIHLLADEIHKRFHNASSVYVRCDRNSKFDSFAQVVATLGEAKLGVNVVTQPEDQSDKRR